MKLQILQKCQYQNVNIEKTANTEETVNSKKL